MFEEEGWDLSIFVIIYGLGICFEGIVYVNLLFCFIVYDDDLVLVDSI